MTHNQTYNWRAFCKESLDQIENYQQALADNFKGWCIHHRLEIQPDGTRMSRQELKGKGLYYDRPASELVFMRFGEHTTLHWLGKHHSDETRKKISESAKGKQFSAETRQKMSEAHKGRTLSAETRLKLSEALKGKNCSDKTRHKLSEAHKVWTLSEEHRNKISAALKGKNCSDKTRQKMSESHKGNHWYNNGVKSILAKACPEGFVPGRLK